MTFLKENLQTLQLTEIPDIDTLQKTFNRLIKIYHPDKNINQKEWAHENTQRLIEAFQSIRHSLQNGKVKPGESFRKKNKPKNNHYDYNDTEEASKVWNEKKYENIYQNRKETKVNTAKKAQGTQKRIRFQLIRSDESGYAIPLEHIVRIISFSDPAVVKGFFGYYVKFENEIYPIVGLSDKIGRFLPVDYIILYKVSGLPGIGLHVSAKMQFLEVRDVHESEFVRHNPHSLDTNGWVMFKNMAFLYPGSYIQNSLRRLTPKSSS